MAVSVTKRGAIALVEIDNPPVNALSNAVRQGILEAVQRVQTDPDYTAAILICKGRTFIAGADVREMNLPPQPPILPDMINAIEASTKPWIAAIHGTALGGGLETALGCHYHVAVPTAKFGLPEVNLGIIPGAGGTVRLPRIIPIEDAVDLVTSGKPINATKAENLGLIDAIIEDDLLEGALVFASNLDASHPPIAIKDRPIAETTPDDAQWHAIKAKVTKKAKGQTAPLKALESIQNAVVQPFAQAYATERAIFLELRSSDQAAAMRHAFFAERAVSKIAALKDVPPRNIEEVAVIGGGTMGAGILVAMMNAGLSVTLLERDDESLQRGVQTIRKLLEASVKRGLLSADMLETRMDALGKTTNYADLSNVDLAIEAVFEHMDVKRDVFQALDANLKPDAILGTNTSYLDVNEIAKATSRPASVIGLHFFSPAHVMKLLEIVQASETAPDIVATGFALAKRLRKIGVLSGVCDGFIGNRILKIYRSSAEQLLLDGASPRDIDNAMRAFGMPMGPFEAQDLGGLDIAYAQRQAAKEAGNPVFAPISDHLCQLERFGQKRGAGWYKYEEGNRKPIDDEQTLAIIIEEATKLNIARAPIDQDTIIERITYPMINEAALILEEKIAARPLDIDMVELHGYGFPRWRGGLMHHADSIGHSTIVAKLQEQSNKPIASLLLSLAENNTDFASLNQ